MGFRKSLWGLILALVLLGIVPRSPAQSDDNAVEILIDSRPTGAAIYLEGAYTIVGRTPLKLERPLVGPYRIRSWKYGFEEYRSEVQFTGSTTTIMINLRRKTPLKAGFRSLIFPGWGQVYTQQRLKALFIGTVQMGTVIAAIVAHSAYLQAKDDYNAALVEFNRKKRDFSERESLLDDVMRRERDMNHSFDRRRTWLWIAGTVWAFNVLDAIFFFPRDHSKFYDMRLSPISATVEPGVVKLTFGMAF